MLTAFSWSLRNRSFQEMMWSLTSFLFSQVSFLKNFSLRNQINAPDGSQRLPLLNLCCFNVLFKKTGLVQRNKKMLKTILLFQSWENVNKDWIFRFVKTNFPILTFFINKWNISSRASICYLLRTHHFSLLFRNR